MFETELAYFKQRQEALVARYRGTSLVLRGKKVIGAYPSPLAAYQAAVERFEPGTFMIQPCEPGPGAYTVTLAPVMGMAR